MQDVAPPIAHGRAQQADTLLMNDLKIRRKLPRQIAYGAPFHLNATFPGQQHVDLLTLAAFAIPGEADPDKNIVRTIGAGSDDARKFP
jgi:hypothetical protein